MEFLAQRSIANSNILRNAFRYDEADGKHQKKEVING